MKKYLVILALVMISDLESFGVLAARQRRRKRENNDETGQPESRDISADEVEAITDDATIVDDEDEIAKNEMLAEWDTHMSDFVPDDMLTVELNPREEIVSKLIRI